LYGTEYLSHGGYGDGIDLEPSSIYTPDKFLSVRETLERIGIKTIKDGQATLYQSCHILHKRGEYAIMLFFELFELDGKPASYGQDDIMRRNLIVSLLEEWDLVKVVNPEDIKEKAPQSSIAIVSHADKLAGNIKFVQKYKIGVKK